MASRGKAKSAVVLLSFGGLMKNILYFVQSSGIFFASPHAQRYMH